MPLKHWSRAGLLLTYWCNARCRSCYLCCGPDRREAISVEDALAIWRGLIEASPNGCRVHLTGGEPFGDWPALIEICRRAKAEGLGPLEKVETNAFWAGDEAVVRRRVEALDAAGMEKLCISADPYHQQYVPIERCRLAARVSEEVLGRQRVQVRWRDWLSDGFDTALLSRERLSSLFTSYLAGGRERLNGRAADMLSGYLLRKPFESFADKACREQILRSKHVHVAPDGWIMPGTCAGILLGRVGRQSVADVWRRLAGDYSRRPVVAALASGGPVALMEQAGASGYVPRDGYAGKCHLCWDVRRHLVAHGSCLEELGPQWIYQPANCDLPPTDGAVES